MDRIREVRRTTMAANGLSRRRHRTNSLRDSPEEDGPIELQEPTRLRDRGSGKKDRDRERDRERERDRLGRNKRRRGDRLMHGGREDGGEDTSEESINDEEDDDDEDGGGGGGGGGGGSGSVRMLPLNPSSLSSSSLTSHHRKSFPPAKVFRPAPPTTWKAADDMIGVSVPRKARSASTKRAHECWPTSSGGIVAEQNHTSPARVVAAPPSPSSSNASVRKKIKPNGGGPKFRPPKSSSKSSSSAQDEIEIEIAEVLYGMMRQPQSQGPSKQEINDSIKFDSREHNNKSSASDGKSRISSPPQNSSSSATPVSAVAPKRKRPRPVKHDDENPGILSVRSSPVSSTTKAESDQRSKMETCSSNSDKNNPGSAPENPANLVPVQASPEPIKPESNALPDSNSKPLTEESEKRKDGGLSKEVVAPLSPKKESSVLQAVDAVREDAKATKANPTISESENQQEEKFQIDLMAPPPTLRTSPLRDVENNLVAEAEKEVKHAMKEDEKSQRMNKDEVVVVETEKVRAKAEENESQKAATVHKERGIDLQLELEKADKVDTNVNGGIVNKKQHQNIQRQQQQTSSEKNVQPNSLPLPMSVPSWPGGLPSMGYMTPLQGVVSMDGTTMSSAAIPQPPHLLFNQPRPKKCATHCYIARNILYNQQIARINPFWSAAAGSASLYGAKPGNLSGVPSTELHGNVPGRAANSTQDKGHSPLAMFSGHIGKDKVSQPANVDNSSRKQILLQQALPPGAAPSNILHGPAFIFPMNQPQAAAAASVRPGSVKSLPVPVTSNGAPSSTSNAAPPNTSVTGAATAPTMSFTYPNMPGNETQYLAILQNNAYPFPIPAHVGAPPTYRGNPAQAFPFFNGSFYSSQMIHPSQIQPQQLPAQSQQSQQGHQNTSVSTGSSSSQKHTQQNQQQKPNNANGSNGGGSLQGFPVTKNPPSQPLQLQQQHQQQQQRQQLQNHHTSNPARQAESEMGSEESDSRLNRATMNMNIYSQNFAMPMQTPNFALMTHAMAGAGAGSNGSHSEKKQQPQHSGPKAGGETSPAFSMPFASINGATAATGLDLSSIAQHHSIMQSSHNYHLMAAAQAASAQLKKGYHGAEEGKNVVNSSNLEEDRKAMSGKIPSTVGQSIAFARPDVSDPSMTSLATNNVIDSSGRSLNLGSASSRATSVVPAAINSNAAGAQQQLQRTQQILQLQKQNQFAAAAVAAARNKTPPSTSNGSIYSDNLPSTSSMSTKFPNAVSAFPQSLVQSSNTVVVQSSQWKNSARATNTSQSPQTMASTPPSSSAKNPQQQQVRSQQAHTQISFAANPKSSTAQVQPANSTQSPSPPVMVGSPTTSSMSKNTGSPRTTTSTSTNNKTSQTGSLSSQQAKNSSTAPTRKSSPVGSRNVPSILSGPQITPSSSTGSKSQLPQQQHQISKQNLQQAQLFFSNPYNMHSQVSQSNSSTSTTSAATGYYLQRRGPDQVQRQGSSGNSSNGAAANNSKGSALPTQGLLHPAQFAAMQSSGNHHQFVPAGFSYVHSVPTTVQVKPAEQKQPAGE